MNNLTALQLTGGIVTILGACFILFASIGLLRMPDVYNRIQAGTKASTLGSILTLFGIGLIHPDWMLKLLLLIGFIIITNPVSSHVLGRIAYLIGVPLSMKTTVDQWAKQDQNTFSL